MHRYHLVPVFLLLTVHLISGANAAASLPGQLVDLNFNLYPAPCPANEMVLRDLKGREVTLAAQRGKVVILNFWKVDCPPCSVEKPILERIYRKYAGRGLEIIAVNLADGQDRIIPYVQQGGYSYTFAFDPSNRFSIRQQALRSGTPATFVVNSNSEAIYEMPGVPTTYVINRRGQVVGNAVGLINWEQGPLTELLESLLGPAPPVVAQKAPAYSEAARQGSALPSSPHVSNPTTNQTQRALQVAQSMPAQSSTRQDAPALPFQGTVESKQPAASQPSVPHTPPSPGYVQAPTMPQAYEPPAGSVRSQKKPEPARTAKPVQRTPKPYVPAPSGVSGAPGHSTAPAARSKKSSAAASPAMPPTAQPFASTSPSTAQPIAPMPPYLPPAMPYSPTGPQGARPNVIPDDSGTVEARIPSNAPAPGFDRFGAAGRAPSGILPPAQPIGTKNPIDGFILDSFGRPGMQAPAVRPSTASDTPASSLFGQIGQDVQNLGAGIKDTFSRIIPGR